MLIYSLECTMHFVISIIGNMTWWKLILFAKLFLRLSSLADDNLTKVNPAIAALWNPNRPLKPAEKYGELYDNEWTDALDPAVEMKELYPDMKAAEIEEVIIRHLYQLVMVSLLLWRSI